MSIIFNEDFRTFKLDTPSSSYTIHIVDEKGYLVHGYYGKTVSDADVSYLARLYENPFTPDVNRRENGLFYDNAPFEYPAYGTGDYRNAAIEIETADGTSVLNLTYVSHRIIPGKPSLEGLPATFAEDKDCDTLIITSEDKASGVRAELFYTAFNNLDVITRSVILTNIGNNGPVKILKVMSACIDMDNIGYDAITLHGGWARERHISRHGLHLGVQSVESFRGESSHQEHPFMAILDHDANQQSGNVYAMTIVYSGNFIASAEVNQNNSLRLLMGINPKQFCWILEENQSFTAPEAVIVYSFEGLDRMSQTFHDLFRKHLIRGKYKDIKRPILINNWEATYFDFDSDKLISIAKSAAENGIEMLVMDDGWFGNRQSDNMALGDWVVNEDKLKGSLSNLVSSINAIPVCDVFDNENSNSDKKMMFGIWIEPEMVSPDSNLYREHPDYAIQVKGREGSLIRNQLVLDYSRKEVVDYIYEMIKSILASANIEYVKWDMNRYLTDIGSSSLSKDKQGELMHRYMLGVYDMQDRLTRDFPNILLENCSAGGSRFDAGMLYYSPQIWCSDDIDAVERLSIQEGTEILYPLSCMGAHVGDCPNHTVFRNTPFETRGHVALAGTFGYELDITKISDEDRAMIKRQVRLYHKYHLLIQNGDYYRISSYADNHEDDCIQIVAKDKSESLITFVQVEARANRRTRRIKLKGLDPNASYIITCDKSALATPLDIDVVSNELRGLLDGHVSNTEMTMHDMVASRNSFTFLGDSVKSVPDSEKRAYILHGDTLMNGGINISPMWGPMLGDYVSILIHLKKV